MFEKITKFFNKDKVETENTTSIPQETQKEKKEIVETEGTMEHVKFEYKNEELYNALRYYDPFPPDREVNVSDIDNETRVNLINNPLVNGYSSLELQYNHYNILIKFLYEIKKIDTVLDLGCGTGNLSSLFETKEYLGVDFNRNLCDIAIPNNSKHSFLCLPIETYLSSTLSDEKKFSLILFSNTFQYKYDKITDEVFFEDYFKSVYSFETMDNFVFEQIKKAYDKLDEQGVLIASFINKDFENEILYSPNNYNDYIKEYKSVQFVTNPFGIGIDYLIINKL